MELPRLRPHEPTSAAAGTDSVLLCVYAPFGTDKVLSTYPDGQSQDLAQHPLVRNLLKVAKTGIHVEALVDRVDEDTFLVEIPAGQPQRMRITSCWKQDMSSPLNLAGFLRRAHGNHPTSALVLALEGHGAGFLPDIDRTQMTGKNITDNGRIEWKVSGKESPALPAVSPVLPAVSPVLPAVSPVLPADHMPISTWGLGDALRRAQHAGVPKVAVFHLNNCFNMSAEVLHTVAPYAEFATGYINYNFFTAGDSYPWVFDQLMRPGAHSALDLARWFADGNDRFLAAKGNHPTVGSVVPLQRMKEIAERVDDLADALLSAMRAASAAQRPMVIKQIREAIERARQLDTPNGSGFELETPDELTDIRSFAVELKVPDFSPHPVRDAALALETALDGLKHYGARDRPWIDESIVWDFQTKDLAMNILLPDPLRRGLWDWRSPFYMNVNPDPNAPRVQPHVIDFLKVTDWVDFIDEYHKGKDENGKEAIFQGLLAAKIAEFPVFNRKFKPTYPSDPGQVPYGDSPGQTAKGAKGPRRG